MRTLPPFSTAAAAFSKCAPKALQWPRAAAKLPQLDAQCSSMAKAASLSWVSAKAVMASMLRHMPAIAGPTWRGPRKRQRHAAALALSQAGHTPRRLLWRNGWAGEWEG